MDIKIKKLLSWAALPVFGKPGDAGADCAAVGQHTIYPGDRVFVSFGWACEVPPGFEMQVRSRSGLALKKGIFVLNAPGTVDSGYRGEVGAIVANFSDEPFVINPGDRIAQIVVAAVPEVAYKEASELSDSERGAGGFGSTGV